jgi:hypothetical protein
MLAWHMIWQFHCCAADEARRASAYRADPAAALTKASQLPRHLKNKIPNTILVTEITSRDCQHNIFNELAQARGHGQLDIM